MPIPVVILQPPLVQLNGPYPSGAYLAAFFRGLSGEFALKPEEAASVLSGSGDVPGSVRWIDASHGFFRQLFSRAGLTLLFSLCREKALSLADRAALAGDDAGEETAFQLRRYVSSEDRWVEWIDGIVSILSGDDRERCHSFIRSPHAPRGARMDAFLSGLEAEPSPDDARILATLALEDLADFIAAVFDPEFSLVRYAESIASSERNFSRVEGALSGPMVSSFLEPYCRSLWDELSSGVSAGGGSSASEPLSQKTLFCLSVPFPGCLVGALAMARSIRGRFGDRAVIAMGGGYVNTELRECENPRLSEYVDILCFDRGFGAFAALFAGGALSASSTGPVSGGLIRAFCPPGFEGYESRVTASLVPDYSDIDFSRYPRLADDPNPMHRLWSDGAWIKAFLAHGCYWHRCSFCDVSLDYICGYRPVDVARLYAGLRAQALAQGVLGVHLVDEAAPPRALRDFALENLKAGGGRLSFWGNIRFEKSFTRDLADFLSAGGLVGVSGGIEIASPEGFKSVDKGIDLENLVACCAAFKEAGVLVHSYLIYGYWNEDEQGVVDAVEVMRQLFAAGLIDSAFWHKFVLTRHSRVFREWERGLHREGTALSPIDEPGDFADNDLRFRGEETSQRYTAPLDAALNAWMSGDGLDTPVRKWFPFPMPAPRIASNLIEGYIASYERKRDHERNRPCDPDARYWWTASRPVFSSTVTAPEGDARTAVLVWWHLGEEVRLELDHSLLGDFSAGLRLDPMRPVGEADAAALARLPRSVFKFLRARGLVKVSPL